MKNFFPFFVVFLIMNGCGASDEEELLEDLDDVENARNGRGKPIESLQFNFLNSSALFQFFLCSKSWDLRYILKRSSFFLILENEEVPCCIFQNDPCTGSANRNGICYTCELSSKTFGFDRAIRWEVAFACYQPRRVSNHPWTALHLQVADTLWML